MPLTVVHSKTLSEVPRRRPLDGFSPHPFSFISSDGSTSPTRKAAMSDQPGNPSGTASASQMRGPAKVTDIAAHRFKNPELFRPARTATEERSPRPARRLMAMAAAVPPLVWLGHALLRFFHVL